MSNSQGLNSRELDNLFLLLGGCNKEQIKTVSFYVAYKEVLRGSQNE